MHDEYVALCTVCGGTEFTQRDIPARVVECAACGHRWVSPRPSQEQIRASYSSSGFYDAWIEGDAGRVAMWRRRLRRSTRLGIHGDVLDVGAGIGTFLALGRQSFGWVVTGTEISSAAVVIARERYGLELLCGQFDELDFADCSFDAVTMWHVLEHLPDPANVLAACHRVLRPGGKLLVAVPNDSDARFLLASGKARVQQIGGHRSEWPRYEPLAPGGEIHLSHFTPKSLGALLRSVGFQPGRVTVDDHYPVARPKNRVKLTLARSASLLGLQVGEAMLVSAKKT